MCKERTLAEAVQRFAQQSGGLYYVICSAAKDLQTCMMYLMWFGEEDILDTMLFKPLDDQQLASPIPEEEIMLLGELQEAQAAAISPPRCKEWAPKPKNMTKLVGASAGHVSVSATTGI